MKKVATACVVGCLGLTMLTAIVVWLRSESDTPALAHGDSRMDSPVVAADALAIPAAEPLRTAPEGAAVVAAPSREETPVAPPTGDPTVLELEIEEVDGCAGIAPIEIVVEEPDGSRHSSNTTPFEFGRDTDARSVAVARARIDDVHVVHAPRAYRVFTTAPGWQIVPETIDLDAYDVDGTPPVIEQSAVLVHRRVFEGHVTDAATRKPIGAHLSYRPPIVSTPLAETPRHGMRVRVSGDPRRVPEGTETDTDADGTYRFVLPYAHASIAIRAVGYQAALWTPAPLVHPSDDVESHDIALRPDPVTAELHISARLPDGRPASFAGLSVVAESIAPYPIELLDESADVVGILLGMGAPLGLRSPAVLSDANDGFAPDELDGKGEAHVRVKCPCRLYVRADAGEACAVARLEITPRAVEHVQLLLASAAGLDLRITKDGEAQPEATRWSIGVSGEPTLREAQAESDGIVRLRGLPLGASVTVHSSDGSVLSPHAPIPASIQAPVTAGTVLPCSVDFVTLARTVVRGVVRDAETGRGIRGQVFATFGSDGSFGVTYCDADGRFELKVSPGTVLDVGANGYGSSRIRWDGAQVELPPIDLTRASETTADATAVIQGRVVAGRAHARIPGAQVALLPRAAASTTWDSSTRDDGTFRIERVPAGHFEIHVYFGALGLIREIDVAAGRVHDVELQLEPLK